MNPFTEMDCEIICNIMMEPLTGMEVEIIDDEEEEKEEEEKKKKKKMVKSHRNRKKAST
jgi:hypothetical protein